MPLRLVLPLLLTVALSSASSTAAAMGIGFDCITGSLAGDCAIGEAQLSFDVADAGSGKVQFTFTNAGPAASVISEIYFDDGTLLGLASIVSGPGVSYVQDASPPNLPGANLATPPFNVTAGFLAEATPSPAMNGVGPNEWVTILFDLQPGGTLADVVDDLTTGALRVGIHVIGFDSGGSESFVNQPVPEPGTAAMLAAGLLLMAARRRA